MDTDLRRVWRRHASPEEVNGRNPRDFFFVPRNDVMSYGVLVLDD